MADLFVNGRADGNGVTPVTVAGPPGAGVTRAVRTMTGHNVDVIAHTYILKRDDGVNQDVLYKVQVDPDGIGILIDQATVRNLIETDVGLTCEQAEVTDTDESTFVWDGLDHS
jgi:hypothetical protein